jgi:hypothetical protein
VNIDLDAPGAAREVARQILDGTMNPNLGCGLIAEICQRNNWPRELQVFHLMAHEQEGHEHLGFDAENTAPLILAECRELLKRDPE